MKKGILFLNLVLFFSFFQLNLFCFGEDFFSGSNFTLATAQNNVSKKELKKQKKVKKEFSKNKKDKDVKPEDLKGYYGTLPDISGDFQYKKQTVTTPSKNYANIEDGEFKETELKKAPVDDALFLDIIVKKEKASTYVNDLQKTKLALTSLKKCIEENGNIQRFNGCVNMLALYSQNLKKKYENKSESLKESYNDILNTDYSAKTLGNLLYNANYYSQYVPTASGEYSKENIEKEKQKLLNKINKTLFLINNES